MRRSARLLLTFVVAAVTVGAIALATSGSGSERATAKRAPVAFPSAEDPDAPAVVWAVGDADATKGGKALGAFIAAQDPDRFLYLGDVYEEGSAKDYRTSYAPVYGALAEVTAPTPGNHEWAARAEGYDPYWRKATGETPPPWYAFAIGGWRVVSLNSEAPHGEGSDQVEWLRAEVRRDPGNCRLALWHRPLESASGHGDQTDVRPVSKALRGHARVSLHGHDHDSQRFRPRDGVHAYVAGAGGRELYPVDEDDVRLRFADDERFAALRIALRPGRAEPLLRDRGLAHEAGARWARMRRRPKK